MSQRETVLEVAGMTCPSCVRHVTAALSGVPGVSSVEVRLKKGTVLIRHDATASTSSMTAALNEAGYDSRIRVGPLHAEAVGLARLPETEAERTAR